MTTTTDRTQGGDLLAVHSIDEFVFSVPELDVARRFYTHFGLDVREEGIALGLYTHGHPHRWARVLEGGDRKRLRWVTLGIHAADAPRFEAHLVAHGIARTSPPAGVNTAADSNGIWIDGPDGLALQLRVAKKSSPSAPPPRKFPPECRNAGRAPNRSRAQPARPLYLSHILLFSADVDRARRFYEDVLGLRLSDRSGSVIAFMHGAHGSDHHMIALARSGGTGLHHSSWCVPSLDDVGMGTQQMIAAGYTQGWGLGRHVLGSNYFRYVRDPWGSYAEYSFDIDYVHASDTWPSADHPGEDSLYVWGPDVPDDFIVNHELPAPAEPGH